jgi:DNA-binding LytR/AlgR family response regulator
MDLVGAYLRIQQVRIGDRFRYAIDLGEAQNGREAQHKYAQVMTGEGESLIRKTIKELGEELAPDQFWQIHRGTIVNVQYVHRVSRSLTGKGVVPLEGRSETLSVSNRNLHLFRQM